MQSKLFDSELKVMGVLWREGDCTAKHISDVLKQEVGWNMNTTYTLIKRCIGKGAIQRSEPNFLCHALIQKEEVQQLQTDELINLHSATHCESALCTTGFFMHKKKELACQLLSIIFDWDFLFAVLSLPFSPQPHGQTGASPE